MPEVNYRINIDNVLDSIKINGKDGEDFSEILGLSEEQANRLDDLAEDLLVNLAEVDDDDRIGWDTEDVMSSTLSLCRDEGLNDIESVYFTIVTMHSYFKAISPVVVIEPLRNGERPFGYWHRDKFFKKLEDIGDAESLRDHGATPLYTH